MYSIAAARACRVRSTLSSQLERRFSVVNASRCVLRPWDELSGAAMFVQVDLYRLLHELRHRPSELAFEIIERFDLLWPQSWLVHSVPPLSC